MVDSRDELILDVFEKKLPRYYNTTDIRTAQVQMAIDVAEFLHPKQKNKKLLFIEAPVGTGKSLGALVPALIECSMDRVFTTKRVVYATATINLQGQLMNEEVPLLRELKLLDTALLAKGKAHYYCHHEMNNAQLRDSIITEKLTNFYTNGSTGQRDEFENDFGEISNVIWDQVNLKVSKRECERCVFSQACPSLLHRNRFLLLSNDLVITNHEQLIRSVLNRLQENQFPPIVPIDPSIIIIDEAHHFLENFLSQLEESITIRELRALSRNKRFPNKLKQSFLKKVEQLDKKLLHDAEKCESLQGRYPLPDYVPTILEEIRTDLLNTLEQMVFQNQGSSKFSLEDDFSNKLELITSRTCWNLKNMSVGSHLTYSHCLAFR